MLFVVVELVLLLVLLVLLVLVVVVLGAGPSSRTGIDSIGSSVKELDIVPLGKGCARYERLNVTGSSVLL